MVNMSEGRLMQATCPSGFNQSEYDWVSQNGWYMLCGSGRQQGCRLPASVEAQ